MIFHMISAFLRYIWYNIQGLWYILTTAGIPGQCDYKILGGIQPQIIISAHDTKQWGTVCGSERWHFLEYENKMANKMKRPCKSSTANGHALTQQSYCSVRQCPLSTPCSSTREDLRVMEGLQSYYRGTTELLQRDCRVTTLTKLWHLVPCMKSKVERTATSVSSGLRQ